MRETEAIALVDVSIRYGNLVAVDRLSLRIRHGEIFGLLGPNGSGKSSTLAAIAGVLEPAAGAIAIEGLSPREHPYEYARRVGLVPQEPALYEELSARDNLAFFGSLYDLRGRDLQQRIDRILERVGLTERARDRVGTYSGGMQRRLNLAVALLHDPVVLLLDEPSAALDPASRAALFATLNELRVRGRAIVFTTHLLDEAEQWCDRAGILRQGRLIACGRPAEILRERARNSTLLGVLREELAEDSQTALRQRLGPAVDLQVIGRRIQLSAADAEQLGLALATLASAGAELESFRTPPAGLAQSNALPQAAALTGGSPCSGG